MSKLIVPQGYAPTLSLYQTQEAIGLIKAEFQKQLSAALNLKRVTAPLFVDPTTGLNDDLNGVERPVAFDIPALGIDAQVVHSLAKWKRYALYRYGFPAGEGLYTDMNAIRRDEEPDNLHSIYVDQWDWEKVITSSIRSRDTLKLTVQLIAKAVCSTLEALKKQFPAVTLTLSPDVYFVTTQELEDQYPELSPRERENACLREHPTAFIMEIGGKLRSGQRHDGRAPDYDDWKLNGDLMFWNPVLECAFELSSMGIRVDADSLKSQLTDAGCEERASLPFHTMVADGTLPLTMGGGIGQSRLCMLLLGKAHIGEVQSSLWDEETRAGCDKAGIPLL